MKQLWVGAAALGLACGGCDFLLGTNEPHGGALEGPPPANASAGTSAPPAPGPLVATSALPPGTTAEPPEPAPMALSLVANALPLVVTATEKSKVSPSESKDGLGGVVIDEIVPGDSVRVFRPSPAGATLSALKAQLARTARPAKSFVREEADLLVYARGDADFAFVVRVTVAGHTYLCQELGGLATAAALERTIAACRTLRAQ